jgi:Cytochrome c
VPPARRQTDLRLIRRVAIFTAFFLIGLMTALSIRNWIVYERVSELRNPVAATSGAIEAGRELYGEHCQKCHGANGNGKGPKADELSVSPGDFTDGKKMGAQTEASFSGESAKGGTPCPLLKTSSARRGAGNSWITSELSERSQFILLRARSLEIQPRRFQSRSDRIWTTQFLRGRRRLPSHREQSGCRSS